MDPQQFDTIAKSFASGLSRRKALTRLGGGGAAALLAALGRNHLDVAAQGGAGASCNLAFVANVRVGPSAGQLLGGTAPGELKGQLTFALDQDGAITQGQLQLADGTRFPLVGQATGRALNLRLDLGNAQQVFVAVGTAEQDLTACRGAADGLVTGPQRGDLGDWHATLTAGTASTSGASGGQTGGAIVTVAGNPTSPTGTTPAPTPSPIPATASTTATTGGGSSGGSCNATVCHGACVDVQTDTANCGGCGFACPAGISCVGAVCCNSGTAACTNDKYCCDGPCVNGHCLPGGTHPTAPVATAPACPDGEAFCNGACIPVLADTSNCGSCGNVCSPGIVCIGGVCRCPAGVDVCNGRCTDITSDPNNCGSCGNACGAGQSCRQSQCQ